MLPGPRLGSERTPPFSIIRPSRRSYASVTVVTSELRRTITTFSVNVTELVVTAWAAADPLSNTSREVEEPPRTVTGTGPAK